MRHSEDTNHNQTSAFGTNLDKSRLLKMQPVPEILAPVGGREQFFAALNAGADAVFLGLKEFNARSRAENFTTEDLCALVPLAHRYGMKVLVTVNILIKDIELADLMRTLSKLEDIGVDAIIVQDLGVAKIARDYFPNRGPCPRINRPRNQTHPRLRATRYDRTRSLLSRQSLL